MKKPLTLIAFSTLLLLGACGGDPKPQPPPEPAPVQPDKPAKSSQPEEPGTSIRIGDDGVKIDSKGTNVSLSGDSAAVEIR